MNLLQRAMMRFAGVKARPSEFLPEWRSGQPIARYDWGAISQAIDRGYRSSSVVATCLDWRGDSLAGIPLKAYRRTKDGYEHAPDSPLQRLLDNPNPFMSTAEIVRRISDHRLLAGNAILLKNRGASNGRPLELWPIRPDYITPVADRAEFISAYEYEHAGVKKRLAVADVIHLKRANPASDYWGIGVLQAGSETVENDRAAIAWQSTLLRRQAITSGVLGVGEELSDVSWERMKTELDQRRLGEARAGETIFIDGVGTLNYSRMGLDAREMALVDSRRLTREDILSMFQVPPPLAGYLERANYSNIETARRIFWQDTVAPDAHAVSETFTRSLAPDFGSEFVVDFDLADVDALQENYGEKLDNFERLIRSGVKREVAAQVLDLGLPDDAFEPRPEPPPPPSIEQPREPERVLNTGANGSAHKGERNTA